MRRLRRLPDYDVLEETERWLNEQDPEDPSPALFDENNGEWNDNDEEDHGE